MPDICGGVSMKTHSKPALRAAPTRLSTPRTAVRSGSSPVLRNPCHKLSEPCGSASMRRQRRDARSANAARLAVKVLLPDPPLRDATVMTTMVHGSLIESFKPGANAGRKPR
jgi:hypothetical protein